MRLAFLKYFWIEQQPLFACVSFADIEFGNVIARRDLVIKILVPHAQHVVNDCARIIQLMDAIKQSLSARNCFEHISCVAILRLKPIGEFLVRSVFHPAIRIV